MSSKWTHSLSQVCPHNLTIHTRNVQRKYLKETISIPLSLVTQVLKKSVEEQITNATIPLNIHQLKCE
jgi:hypothetical protein